MSEKMKPLLVRESLHQELKLEAIKTQKTLEKHVEEILLERKKTQTVKNNG